MIEVYDGKKLTGSYATIQDAVDAASEGDTIKLPAGTFNETVTVDKALSFEGAGAGSTIMDGSGLGGSGLHLVGDLGDKEKVEISGITFQNYSVAGVEFDDDATLKELKITDSHFEDNALNGVRVGGDYDPVALEKAEIKDSSFVNNGDGTNNGDGDILFFQYYGDAKIEDVSITGGGTGDNGIQFRGDDGPIGKVQLKDVDIDGSYAKTGIAVYNYSDGKGLKFNHTAVTATTGWDLPFNADGVGGKIDTNQLDTSGAPGAAALQGDDGDNDLKADKDSASVLRGNGGDDKMKGGDADDVLLGGDGDDKADGKEGDDVLDGGAGGDDLKGHKGDDAFIGAAGDDKIDGGKGFDVAVYGGAIDDFDFSVKGHDKVTITDTRGGSPEGTDKLKDVELLIFTNGTADTGDDVYFDVATQTAFADATEFRYEQNFDGSGDTGGWNDGGSGWYGTATQVPSGTGGIASASDGGHVLIDGNATGDAPYDTFLNQGGVPFEPFTASIKIYLDPQADGGSGWADGEGFEYTVAANTVADSHLRDYVFHVTQDTSTGDMIVDADNNAYSQPREDLETIAGTAVIAEDGWYTFEHRFYENGSGDLAVDMVVLDENDSIVFSETRTAPSDDIANVSADPRYGWFTEVSVAGGLAVDDLTIAYESDQTFAYPTVDDLFA